MHVPDYYEFYSRVRIISGRRALEQIPAALTRMNATNPMIISDKGVSGAGLVKLVLDAAKKSKVQVRAVFDDVPPDSEVKVVSRVAQLYRAKGCDSIIAVGGGSVLDTAKGVNILVSENSDDLMKFTGFNRIKRRLKPLVAVPTTSGTGSEMTLAAVIADHDKNFKIIFGSNFLLPDAAVLDPRMTLTLPAHITAFTAMDAMTHACEAYTCLAKNPFSDAAALAAIELISTHLLRVIKKPKDLDGRLALANASSLAGMSFSNSTVGMVHSIGHAIGGVCRVPHGLCMSMLLPYGLEYNFHKSSQYTAELLLPLAGAEVYAATPKKERAEKAIAYIRKMNQDLYDATGGRHARCLKEVVDASGTAMIPVEKLPEIARTAMGDAVQFYNPEDLDYNDFMMVLESAWEGAPLDRKRVKKG